MDEPSGPASPETPPPAEPKPLTYEETPIIEPVTEPMPPAPGAPVGPPPPPTKKGFSFFSLLGNLILFFILFGAGVGLSLFLRQYLPSGMPALPSGVTPPPAPTIFPTLAAGETSVDPYAGWKTYQVISGLTRQPVAGISFKLSSDVVAPICDGGNCASQGTYLPGGTRFTVAPRGAGQVLADYRGRIVSDLSGQAFSLKQASVSGKPAVEFSGLFTGSTNGGYTFNQMHGYMIEVTDALALEINHFTPSGVNADFASDDELFAKIVKSLNFSFTGLPKGAVLPTLPPTLSPSPTASPTGVSSY